MNAKVKPQNPTILLMDAIDAIVKPHQDAGDDDDGLRITKQAILHSLGALYAHALAEQLRYELREQSQAQESVDTTNVLAFQKINKLASEAAECTAYNILKTRALQPILNGVDLAYLSGMNKPNKLLKTMLEFEL